MKVVTYVPYVYKLNVVFMYGTSPLPTFPNAFENLFSLYPHPPVYPAVAIPLTCGA